MPSDLDAPPRRVRRDHGVVQKKPTGRVTPKKGSSSPPQSTEKWEVQDSRSVRSGWIWRGFLMLTLLAVGVAIIMEANHHGTLAIMWGVIAAGWFAISMWLWRQHSRYMRGG
jgi:hypothetical protein